MEINRTEKIYNILNDNNKIKNSFPNITIQPILQNKNFFYIKVKGFENFDRIKIRVKYLDKKFIYYLFFYDKNNNLVFPNQIGYSKIFKTENLKKLYYRIILILDTSDFITCIL